ncbi:MAG: elongation factor P [Candidatus Berkelbacteria bacterium]|nr:elongation factor P [Candidatus Berkelbacteria bacterium]
MLSITNLKLGTKISLDGEPFVVTFSEHSKQGRSGAVMRTRLKSLISGATIAKTFQGADKIDEAELSHKTAQFLYFDSQAAYFMDSENFEQFEIPTLKIADQIDYLTENAPVEILYNDDRPISIELPIKMTFTIISTPPGVRGNSAGTVTKMAEINTGGQIAVPLFIKEGDKIVVDTRDGKYVEREN